MAGKKGVRNSAEARLNKKKAALLHWELLRNGIDSKQITQDRNRKIKEEKRQIREEENRKRKEEKDRKIELKLKKQVERRKEVEHKKEHKKITDQEIVEIPCGRCGSQTTCKRKYLYRYKTNGKICEDCHGRRSGEVFRNYHLSKTPEERTKLALYGISCRKTSGKEMVERSWATIKASPEKYKELCQKHHERSLQVWQNYPDETKKKILDAWMLSKSGVRSKLSDEFKQLLVEAKLYDGFESELHFHGFYPDEINHNLKLIIEVNGWRSHCDPRKHKDPNEYVAWIKRTVAEQWKRDEIKVAAYKRNGYEVVVVWEIDIRKDPNKEIRRVKRAISKQKKALGIL